MKKVLVLSIIMITALLLSACNKTASGIIEENGKYYLVINNLPEASTETWNKMGPVVEFESIEEMYTDLKTLTFSEEELGNIAEFSRDSQGRIKFLNIENLYDLHFPSTVTLDHIGWTGSSYTFWLKLADATIHVTNYSKSRLDELYNSRAPEENNYLYKGKTTKICSLKNEDAYYRIIELYDERISLTIPVNVECYVEQGDICFKMDIYDFENGLKITDDWLMQFELRPFTEN